MGVGRSACLHEQSRRPSSTSPIVSKAGRSDIARNVFASRFDICEIGSRSGFTGRVPKNIFCYFARLSDGKGNHLTAVRRASSFKGILASKLLSFLDDSLKIVEDHVFKLDEDFDFLIDAAGVHVLRPAGFESIGQLRDEIMKAAPTNIKAIQADITFVDFGPIRAYALEHPRAARYLASIRLQENKNIDKASLKRHCTNMGLDVKEKQGTLSVASDSIMDFLAVLDRRLYQVELVKDAPESFFATGRSKIVKP
ncbi:MAG: Kiwa anti-phage protein KwaB-like domain-containing protein [Candidatus Acidiferrum sp.]